MTDPDAYELHKKKMIELWNEIHDTSSLITDVHYMGEFIVMDFITMPTYRKDELFTTLTNILTHYFDTDYVVYKEHEKNLIFRRSGI